MSEAIAVPTVVDEPMDFTVIATSPKDMETGQRSLILWCARKIEAEKNELREVTAQLETAKAHKWKTDGWARQVKLATLRVEFYRKIKAALEAGYYIVPPFPIDIFAIRTDRKNPAAKRSTSHWDRHEQSAQLLPQGDGQYVSNVPQAYTQTIPLPPKDGKPQERKEYFAKHFLPVAFPFKFARSEVMEATGSAMALKLFDRFGLLPRHSSPDPIVCGQILKPDRWHTPVTFFVAWWLDTRTL